MSGLFGGLFGRSKADDSKSKPAAQPPKAVKTDMFSGMALKAPAKPRPSQAEMNDANYNPPSFRDTSVSLPQENLKELPYLPEDDLNFSAPQSGSADVEVKPRNAAGLPSFGKGPAKGGLPSFSSAPKAARPAVFAKNSAPDDFPDEELKLPTKDPESPSISDKANDLHSPNSAPISVVNARPTEYPIHKPSSVRSGQSSEGTREDSKSLDFNKMTVKRGPADTGYREPPEIKKRREERERAQKEADERQRQELERYGTPENLVAYIKVNLSEHSIHLQGITATQQLLIDEEKELQAAISHSRELLTKTQAQMDEASANEDYETAEQKREEIEQLSASMVKDLQTISEKHNEYAELETQKSALYELQRTFLNGTLAKSKDYLDKEEAQLAGLRNSTKAYTETTSENLEAFSIEIEVCQEENSKRQNEVSAQQEELQTKIKQQTGELEEAKAKFEGELTEVDREIAELEAKLATLRGQQKHLNQQIAETDAEIAAKLENFQAVIAELTGEETYLEGERQEIEGKKVKLTSDQASFKAELQAQQNAIDVKAAWINNYSTIMADAQAEVVKIEGIINDRKQSLAELQRAEQALIDRQKAMQEAEEYEQEVKRNYDLFMQSIVQKEARIREIDTRIPGLEAEKKNLASARQFKVRAT